MRFMRALSLLEFRAVPAKKKRALRQLIRRSFRRSLPVPHAPWRGANLVLIVFLFLSLGFLPHAHASAHSARIVVNVFTSDCGLSASVNARRPVAVLQWAAHTSHVMSR
jgi:hypothetical protein